MVAYEELTLKPSEFYDLTISEFYKLRKAKMRAKDDFWSRASVLASAVIAQAMADSKQKIRYEELRDLVTSPYVAAEELVLRRQQALADIAEIEEEERRDKEWQNQLD